MTLIRAMDKYRRPPTSPIASLRGKCFPAVQPNPGRRADQCLRWSAYVWCPRRNRSGDPILTMEPLCGSPFSQVARDRRGQR